MCYKIFCGQLKKVGIYFCFMDYALKNRNRYCVITLLLTGMLLLFCTDKVPGPFKKIRKLLPPTVLKKPPQKDGINILFLHHSTGRHIWEGGVAPWFDKYNNEHNTAYHITGQEFPKEKPYGWNNYPYDYWNIWVKNAGNKPYKKEPTLEMITSFYNVVIFKHCYPVSRIASDQGSASVASMEKRVENYKEQYRALKIKMKEFPEAKFILWTGAALVKGAVKEAEAKRAHQFFTWVREEWDEAGDNIFLWDFYTLETEGGLYLLDSNASGPDDSHPNEQFSKKAAPLFCQRIIDVINGHGDTEPVADQSQLQ